MLPFRWCSGYFAQHCDKIPNKEQLKSKGLRGKGIVHHGEEGKARGSDHHGGSHEQLRLLTSSPRNGAGNREDRQEVGSGYKTPKPVPGDPLPLVKLHLLKVPKEQQVSKRLSLWGHFTMM